MAAYLLLAAVEIFLLRPLVDMITMNFWARLAIYCILLLIANPLLTRMIADRFDLNVSIEEDEDA
jgi:hypothetical protein